MKPNSLISKTKFALIALAAFGMTTLAAGSAEAQYRGSHDKVNRGQSTYSQIMMKRRHALTGMFNSLDKNKDGILSRSDFLVRTKTGHTWKRTWKRTRRGWKRVWKRVAKYSTSISVVGQQAFRNADYNKDWIITKREYFANGFYQTKLDLGMRAVNPAHTRLAKAPKYHAPSRKRVARARFGGYITMR